MPGWLKSKSSWFAGRQAVVVACPHKTASTSFGSAVSTGFSDKTICPFHFFYQFDQANRGDWSRFKFIRGHLSISQVRCLFPESVILSIVREPKRRLVSSYFFWRGLAIEPHLRLPLATVSSYASRMSLKEFLKSNNQAIVRSTDNYLTRFFGGGEFGSTAENRTQLFLPEGQSMESVCQLALNNIEQNVSFVAIAEDYRRSLTIAEQVINRKIDTEDDFHMNKTPAKLFNQEIDKETEELLSQRMCFDQQIYQFCRDLFHKRLLDS